MPLLAPLGENKPATPKMTTSLSQTTQRLTQTKPVSDTGEMRRFRPQQTMPKLEEIDQHQGKEREMDEVEESVFAVVAEPEPPQQQVRVGSMKPGDYDLKKRLFMPVECPSAWDSAAGDPNAKLILDCIADDRVTEVMVSTNERLMVKAKGHRMCVPGFNAGNQKQYHDMLNKCILSLSTIEQPRPIANSYKTEMQIKLDTKDGREPVFCRLHAMTPPTVHYATLTIAKRPRKIISMQDMIGGGSMTQQMAQFIQDLAARARVNILVSGNTGSGKTTLLLALVQYSVQPSERVVVLEDVPELEVNTDDVIYMVTSPRRPGEEQLITLSWLVAETLRMRQDRVIVGETRSSEAADLIKSANSGSDVAMLSTIHGSSEVDALQRLVTLSLGADGALSEATLRKEAAKAFPIVIQNKIVKKLDGSSYYRIEGITEFTGKVLQNGIIESQKIFEYDEATDSHILVGPPSTAMLDRMIYSQCESVNYFMTPEQLEKRKAELNGENF